MYTGRWYDAESGNYYYRARYYSPSLGRFLQRDPIGYYDSKNLYQYVGNNPANWIDPTGKVWVLAWITEKYLERVLIGYICGVAVYQMQEFLRKVPIWKYLKDKGKGGMLKLVEIL